MCGATRGGPSLDGIDIPKQAVIQGIVLRDDEPVGTWTLRTLAPSTDSVDKTVVADLGLVADVAVSV